MFTKLFALFACIILSGCGADTGSTQVAQPSIPEEIKDENKEESKAIGISKEDSNTTTSTEETVSVKSAGTSVGSTSSASATATSSPVGVSSTSLKLTMTSCVDPDASVAYDDNATMGFCVK